MPVPRLFSTSSIFSLPLQHMPSLMVWVDENYQDTLAGGLLTMLILEMASKEVTEDGQRKNTLHLGVESATDSLIVQQMLPAIYSLRIFAR